MHSLLARYLQECQKCRIGELTNLILFVNLSGTLQFLFVKYIFGFILRNCSNLNNYFRY